MCGYSGCKYMETLAEYGMLKKIQKAYATLLAIQKTYFKNI